MKPIEPRTAGLAAILAGAICLSPLPLLLRGVAALALVAYLPGYCLVAAIARQWEPSRYERTVAAIVTSLAVTILVGFALNAFGSLGRAGWANGLALVAIVASLVAPRRRPPPHVPARPAMEWTIGSRLPTLVAALVCAVTAFNIARYGALAQSQSVYTDFWMVPATGIHPSSAEIGVSNHERGATSYTIDVVSRGTLTDQIPPFILRPGEVRTLRIALPSVAFEASPTKTQDVDASDGIDVPAATRKPQRVGDTKLRVEARLYKDGDRTLAYRNVWAAVAAPTKSTPRAKLPMLELDAKDIIERGPDDVSDDARVDARIDAHFIAPKAKPKEP